MNETTRNLLEVFGSLPPWQLPPVLFRLYFDDQGQPIEYSQQDKPGNYIDITPELFRDQPQNVRVIDGRLHFFEPRKMTKKLVPGPGPGTHCHPRDICVIVQPAQPCVIWSLKSYEPH